MRFSDICILLVVATAVIWGVSAALPHIRDLINELATVYLWI
jgi:hypothetical protein